MSNSSRHLHWHAATPYGCSWELIVAGLSLASWIGVIVATRLIASLLR